MTNFDQRACTFPRIAVFVALCVFAVACAAEKPAEPARKERAETAVLPAEPPGINRAAYLLAGGMLLALAVGLFLWSRKRA